MILKSKVQSPNSLRSVMRVLNSHDDNSCVTSTHADERKLAHLCGRTSRTGGQRHLARTSAAGVQKSDWTETAGTRLAGRRRRPEVFRGNKAGVCFFCGGVP